MPVCSVQNLLLCFLWCWGTHKCWAPLAFRARWFGSQFLCGSCKSWGDDVYSSISLLFIKKPGVGGSLPIVQCCARDEVYGTNAFLIHFDVDIFLVAWFVIVSPLVSGLLLRNWFVCSCTVAWGKKESQAFLIPPSY